MKFKLGVGLVTALAAFGACAQSQSFSLSPPPGNSSVSFSSIVGTSFTDTFTFNFVPLPASSAGVATIINLAFTTPDVNFNLATLNSVPLTILNGVVSFGVNPAPVVGLGTNPVFTLVVSGTAAAISNYSGTLTMNVTPVPEPGTYAMLLAGLGAVGFVAARRRASA